MSSRRPLWLRSRLNMEQACLSASFERAETRNVGLPFCAVKRYSAEEKSKKGGAHVSALTDSKNAESQGEDRVPTHPNSADSQGDDRAPTRLNMRRQPRWSSRSYGFNVTGPNQRPSIPSAFSGDSNVYLPDWTSRVARPGTVEAAVRTPVVLLSGWPLSVMAAGSSVGM